MPVLEEPDDAGDVVVVTVVEGVLDVLLMGCIYVGWPELVAPVVVVVVVGRTLGL